MVNLLILVSLLPLFDVSLSRFLHHLADPAGGIPGKRDDIIDIPTKISPGNPDAQTEYKNEYIFSEKLEPNDKVEFPAFVHPLIHGYLPFPLSEPDNDYEYSFEAPKPTAPYSPYSSTDYPDYYYLPNFVQTSRVETEESTVNPAYENSTKVYLVPYVGPNVPLPAILSNEDETPVSKVETEEPIKKNKHDLGSTLKQFFEKDAGTDDSDKATILKASLLKLSGKTRKLLHYLWKDNKNWQKSLSDDDIEHVEEAFKATAGGEPISKPEEATVKKHKQSVKQLAIELTRILHPGSGKRLREGKSS